MKNKKGEQEGSLRVSHQQLLIKEILVNVVYFGGIIRISEVKLCEFSNVHELAVKQLYSLLQRNSL